MSAVWELAVTFSAPKTESVRPARFAYRTSAQWAADLTLTVLRVRRASTTSAWTPAHLQRPVEPTLSARYRLMNVSAPVGKVLSETPT